jgi:hypothetical protein
MRKTAGRVNMIEGENKLIKENTKKEIEEIKKTRSRSRKKSKRHRKSFVISRKTNK